MKDSRRMIELHRSLAGPIPLKTGYLLAKGNKLFKFSLLLKFDLQFGNIVVRSVIKVSQQSAINDLSNLLFRPPDLRAFGDVEHYNFGRYLDVDEIYELRNALVLNLLLKKLTGGFT